MRHDTQSIEIEEQAPGMPDAVFDGQVATLGRELRLLRSLLGVGSCGT